MDLALCRKNARCRSDNERSSQQMHCKVALCKKNLTLVFFQCDFTLNFEVIHTSNDINDLKVFLVD